MRNWVLLVYKIPSKPTSSRVYVWRKLKKLGAILWHDAVWILPAHAKSKEHFQWLASDIGELGGEAQVWLADSLLHGQEEILVGQFQSQSDDLYQAIINQLEEKDTDLAAAARSYQQAKQHDYFHSELGDRVRDLLLKAREGGGTE